MIILFRSDSTKLYNQSELQQAKLDYFASRKEQALHRIEIAIDASTASKENLAACLMWKAEILFEKGEQSASLKVFHDAILAAAAECSQDRNLLKNCLDKLCMAEKVSFSEQDNEQLDRDPLIRAAKTAMQRHDELFQAFNNLVALADTNESAGKYGAAIKLNEVILEYCQNVFGVDCLANINHLNNLAKLYRLQGNYTEAEILFSQSRQSIKKHFGPKSMSYAIALSDLGITKFDQGKLKDAEQLYLSAKDLEAELRRNKINNQKELETELSNPLLNRFGMLYTSQGKIKEAEKVFEQLLDRNKNLPLVWSNLAHLYLIEDRFCEAEVLLNYSLDLLKEQSMLNPLAQTEIWQDMAQAMTGQGRCDEAISLLERALRIQENSFGKNSYRVSTTLAALASVHRTRGDLKAAESLGRRALKISEEKFGRKRRFNIYIVLDLARTCDRLGNQEEAKALFERAVELSKEPGESDLEKADVMLAMAQYYKNHNLTNSAEQFFKESRRLAEDVWTDSPHMAISWGLVEKSKLYAQRIFEKSSYKKTIVSNSNLSSIKSKIADQEKFFGKTHPRVIQAEIEYQFEMARINANPDLSDLNELAKSWLQLAKDVENLCLPHTQGGPDRVQTNRLRSWIKQEGRNAYHWFHDSGLSLAYILSAKKQAGLGLKVVSSLEELNNHCYMDSISPVMLLELAKYYETENRLNQARAVVSRALAVCGKPERSKFRRSECQLELARISLKAGDALDASRTAEDALKEVQLGPSTPKELLRELEQVAAEASAYVSGNPDQQVAACKKYLERTERLFGTDNIQTMKAMLSLACKLRQRAEQVSDTKNQKNSIDLSRSEKLLRRVLEQLEKTKKQDSEFARITADTYTELANLQLCSTENAKRKCFNFQQYMARAADINLNDRSPERLVYAATNLEKLAVVDYISGQKELGKSRVLQAAKLLDTYIRVVLPELPLSGQMQFINNLNYQIETSPLSVAFDEKSLNTLYTYQLRWKGLLVEEMQRRGLLLSCASLFVKKPEPASAGLLKRYNELNREILNLYMQPCSRERLEESIKLTKEKEAIEGRFSFSDKRTDIDSWDTGYKNIRLKLSAPTPELIRKSLSHNEAFVDIYKVLSLDESMPDMQTHYVAVVSLPGRLQFLDLGPSKLIDYALFTWRNDLKSIATPADIALYKSIDLAKVSAIPKPESGAQAWCLLQSLLCRPLAKILPPEALQLWVCEDGELGRLPWGVLFRNYGHAKSIMLTQVDSPREFCDLRSRRNKQNSKPNKILLLGGVDYQGRANALIGTENEIKQIGQLAAQFKLNKITLSDAAGSAERPSRSNILKELPKCRYAHFATHGYFLDSSPATQMGTELWATRNPLLCSGLITGLDKRAKPEEDNGILTAQDILESNLWNCDLVSLSACETGRGRELRGQGILGLRSAAMAAGAKSMLISLWRVPDKATSELMVSFYKRVFEGSCPSLALKEAQDEIRKQKKWQAHYYWAGWIIVGDGVAAW